MSVYVKLVTREGAARYRKASHQPDDSHDSDANYSWSYPVTGLPTAVFPGDGEWWRVSSMTDLNKLFGPLGNPTGIALYRKWFLAYRLAVRTAVIAQVSAGFGGGGAAL